MAKEKQREDSVIEDAQHWQWIKGDDSGNVVTIKNVDDKWIHFHEGGRLAKDLKEEFLQLLDSDLAGEFINKTIKVGQPPSQTVVEIPTKQISPIRVLFNKQKKNNKVKLLLEFPVNIPSKDLYELMSTSFDKEEVSKHLESFILDQLSQGEINDCLFDSIKSLIESKYKSE